MSAPDLPRADAAASPEADRTADLGMILFLGSWAMMFAGLFFGYATLRWSAPVWPPPGEKLPLLLPSLSTVVIAASSVSLQRGVNLVRKGRSDRFLRWLIDTIALGGLFVALQWVLWSTMWHGGLMPGSGRLAGMFYVLTVFHAAHVVVGVGILLALLPRAVRRRFDAGNHGAPRRAAMFWHFVGVAWLAIYLAVFVL